MPRPRKSLGERLSLADLRFALDALIERGRTTAQEVLRLARIRELRDELAALVGGRVSTAGRGRRGPGRPPARGKAAKKRGRRFTMTPKMRAARKLQGRYLGLLRGLADADRAAVRKIARAESVAAAVKEAEARKKKV